MIGILVIPAFRSAWTSSGAIFFLAWRRTFRDPAADTSSDDRLPGEAVRNLPVELAFLGDDLVGLVEQADDILVRTEAQRPQKNRGQEFFLPVEPDVEVVFRVILELDPGPPVRDDFADVEAFVLGLPEKDARRPLELADDDPFDAVENERALLRHQGDVAEVDFLLFDVFEPFRFRGEIFFPGNQLHFELERHRIGIALLDTFLGRILHLEPDPVPAVFAERELDLPRGAAVRTDFLLGHLDVRREVRAAGAAFGPGVFHSLEPPALAFPVAYGIAEEFQFRRFLEIGYREDVLEGRLEPDLLPFLRQEVHLKVLVVGAPLDVQEVGHGEDRLDLRKVDPLKISIFFF